MSDLKNRALQMLGHGLPVFPTVEYLKHPGKIEKHLDGSFEGIPALWEEHADSTTGAFLRAETLPEGYVILDCDWDEQEYFDDLASQTNLDLSALTTVRTTSGGQHLYLRCPNPNTLPLKVRITFSDGAVGKIDVRARGYKHGIMLPGSRAKNKAGEIGLYEALGEGTEDAIYNLQWSVLTAEQQQHIEDVLGAKELTEGDRGEGGGSASQAFAKAIAPLMLQLPEGFDTNDCCTTLANVSGMMLRTGGSPEHVAEDCWAAMLSVAPRYVKEQFEGDPRHKKSFITNAAKSLKLTQKEISAMIAEARNPKAALLDSAAEKEILTYFGGAVGAKLDSQGGGTFAYLRDTEYGFLHEQDWDHPDLVKVKRESMFGSKAGLSWFESIQVALHMQGKAAPDRFQETLRRALFSNSETDEANHLRELNSLREAYDSFSAADWKLRRESLPKNQAGRWLWYLAPLDSSNRRNIPFVAMVGANTYIAVPPACSLTPKTMEMLGDPVDNRSGKNGQKIYLYAIPEEVQGD